MAATAAIVEDDFDKKCKIASNDVLGRHVIAAVDLKAGETILIEPPLLVAATNGEQRCANCFKLCNSFCSICSVFFLCADCNLHNSLECQLLSQKQQQLQLQPLQLHAAEINAVLKSLLLQQHAATSQQYNALLQMESHVEQRRNSEIWQSCQQNVVQPIKDSQLLQQIWSEQEIAAADELLQRLCGIFDVNSFEIRAPDENALRAIYQRAALFSHNCCANTEIAIGANFQIKIYVNQNVAKNEVLHVCYTNVLLGTAERREMLQIGKYFHCNCARCEDATELGSHMSSILCSPCAANKRHGYLVKQQTSWQCLTCAQTLSTEFVKSIEERAKEEIFHAKDDLYRYELLLAKLSRFFHPNHYLMFDLKQNIAAILRAIIMNTQTQRPGRKVYERKQRLCAEILQVLQIIQPGISRLKAIALYELYNVAVELNRMRYAEKQLNALQLLEKLQEAEAMLRESLKMLLYAPVDTAEGQLAKSMLMELKELQQEMQQLQT